MKMHVYAHTHWDYEWYFTASESIIQLIYHMDEVITALREGILQTYVLDSQVSILEEYLSYMPENSTIVKQLVASGKLMIGPWYTQSDELIISGESMARNLWYGMRYANSLGGCMRIGYLPDSFGQSKDMPKLYEGFGIHEALFWRGVPNDVCKQREFYWQASDGSQVLTYNIRDGYFYGGNLIYTDDVDKVEQRLLAHAGTQVQLLPLGGDQRYVDFNLKERLAYYNERSTHDIHYIESDLEHFFQELRQEEGLPILEGEFIDASVSKIHHSIYSTRYDHKQLLDRVERRLLYQLEPFMVMQEHLGIEAKRSVLETLWKKFLLNHAHDSACGCNSDETNAAILQRLTDCDQMSAFLLDYQVRKVSESMQGRKENDIYFYNTLPYTRTRTQEIIVNTKLAAFDLLDEEGATLPYDILSQERVYGGSIRKDTTTYEKQHYYYQTRIRVSLTMPPLGMRKLCVEETTTGSAASMRSTACIENEHYHIDVHEGALRLYLKQEKRCLEDFLYLEDGGDEGDTYDYSYPKQDHLLHLNFAQAKVSARQGQLSQEMVLHGTWQLPYHLNERSHGQCTTACPYQLTITLQTDGLIRFALEIENKAIEHRLRIVVRGLHKGEHSVADTAFGTIQRAHHPKHMEDWQEIGYREEPTPIYPMLHYVSNYVTKQSTLTCYVQGIKEYEILDEQDIALTLFRSVPLLGKPDLQRRPGIASGQEFRYIPTPDSEMKQRLTYRFACTYAPYDALRIHKEWLNDANDFLHYQLQEHNRFVNTQKYFVTHPYPKDIVFDAMGLSMDACEHMVFSSLYPIEDGQAALRMYNISDQDVEADALYLNLDEAKRCTMELATTKVCGCTKKWLRMKKIRPEELQTYKFPVK